MYDTYGMKDPEKGDLRFKKTTVEKGHWLGDQTLYKKSILQQYTGVSWKDIPEDSEYIYI
jgi:hypothetical protein